MPVKNLRSISIKGKLYVEVKERILYLANQEEFDYSIQTDYQYFDDRRMWVVKAILTIYKDGKEFVYTGHAQEVESDDYRQVNYASALENAETSAVGRACAMAGIGVIDSIASADEIHKAANRSTEPTASPAADEKAWLSDKQCEQAVEKIKAGQKEIYNKTLESFKVNKRHREELAQALREIS